MSCLHVDSLLARLTHLSVYGRFFPWKALCEQPSKQHQMLTHTWKMLSLAVACY